MFEKKAQRKIKNFLLYPRFQLRFAAFFLIVSILSSVSFYLSTLYFFHRFEQKGLQVGIPKHHVFFVFIKDLQWEMAMIVLITALITIVLITVGAIVLSHKVVGPLQRFKESFRHMRMTGKIQRISLREKDSFRPLADDINKFLDSIKHIGPGEKE